MPHNYIICTTQRSGKTWLVRTLSCLGAGEAHEFVTALHRGQQRLVDVWERDGLAGFVEAIVRQQVGSECDRPAGLSVPRNELSWLARRCGLSPADVLDRVAALMGGDTKLIFLVRRDLVAQAVSRFLLRKTGYGHSFESGKNRRRRDTVDYDAEAIFESFAWSRKAYRSWEAVLKPRPHHLIYYEELVSDTVNEIRRLLEYIDFGQDVTDADIRRCAGTTKRVGDALNDEMIERFLNEPAYQAKIARAQKRLL